VFGAFSKAPPPEPNASKHLIAQIAANYCCAPATVAQEFSPGRIRAGRRHPGTIRLAKMETVYAYLAGIIDINGYIFGRTIKYPRGKNQPYSYSYFPTIGISTTSSVAA
jgi:hypothetical protein